MSETANSGVQSIAEISLTPDRSERKQCADGLCRRGSATFTGGGSAVTLDGSLTVTDASSATFTGATVTISSGFVTGDVLDYTASEWDIGNL